MNFTENELQVMQILWNAKTDLSRKDIIEQSPNRTWKDNSIHVLLNSLMKKGAVKGVGMQPAGKGYARTFAADISQEEYLSAQMTVSPPKGKDAFVGLFAALVDQADLSDDTLDELQKILDERKKKP